MKLIRHTEELDCFLVKEWVTKVGLKARIHKFLWSPRVKEITSMLHDHHTGYVLVPKGMRITKKIESDLMVHGGITFNSIEPKGADKGRWVGFDFAHYGDENIRDQEKYATEECEVLAAELVELNSRKKQNV